MIGDVYEASLTNQTVGDGVNTNHECYWFRYNYECCWLIKNDSERVVEDEPEYVDCIDVTVPYKPIVTVKTETNVQVQRV